MNHIYKFIRNKKNRKIGVIAASAIPDVDNQYGLGWSLTNTSHGDTFNKDLAVEIAINRAVNGTRAKVPASIVNEMVLMRERSERYFKDRLLFNDPLLRTSEDITEHSADIA